MHTHMHTHMHTAAECQQAAKALGGKHTVTQTDELPYCGVNEVAGTYSFEVTGLKENAGNKKCDDTELSCVCKKGLGLGFKVQGLGLVRSKKCPAVWALFEG